MIVCDQNRTLELALPSHLHRLVPPVCKSLVPRLTARQHHHKKVSSETDQLLRFRANGGPPPHNPRQRGGPGIAFQVEEIVGAKESSFELAVRRLPLPTQSEGISTRHRSPSRANARSTLPPSS